MFELGMYSNKLHGEITNCFDGFKKISQLVLGSNKLQGLIPATFKNLRKLELLDLSNNNFTGFADSLSFNPQLQILHLNGNAHLNVDGNRLLKALQPCAYNLRMIVASNCGLKGEISNSLWSFNEVLKIDLSNNVLTGRVPINDAYDMKYLFHLSLASNNFTGDLPINFFSHYRL